MRAARPVLLVPLLLLVACVEAPSSQAEPPLPDEPGSDAPGGAPHEAAVGTTYRRTLVFLDPSSDTTLLVLWDLANRVEADSIRRSARGWMARNGEWSLFMDDEWATPPVGGLWRTLVRSPARMIVGMGDVWNELRYEHGVRELSLGLGPTVSRWDGRRGETFRLRRGMATLAGVEAGGLVLDAFTARPSAEDEAGELALLTAGGRLHLLVVGPQGADPARAWGRLDGDRHHWPDVAWSWHETRTFESARREVPVVWRFHSPWPPMSGDLESVSSHLQTIGDEGALLPVLGAYAVSGAVTIEGTELPVRGLVRHVQR